MEEQISSGTKNLKKIAMLGCVIVAAVALSFFFGNRSKEESNSEVEIKKEASALEAVILSEGGVEVSVTPMNVSPQASEWLFGVSLTTHSGDLSEDMVEVSELILNSEETLKPVSWEGSPPGGHHRSGVLKFTSRRFQPSEIALKIYGVGGVEERVFEWALNKSIGEHACSSPTLCSEEN